jgi:N-methylhydantoinase A
MVGVDVGGTFTDVVLRHPNGHLTVVKVPSTPADQSVGFIDGLSELSVDPAAVSSIVHGTTVATNTVIERTGANCLLVTTKGFGDVLELGRRDRPEVYGLRGTVAPLVPRYRRLEVDERVRADGSVALELNAEELLAALEPHMDEIRSVVVSFFNAYCNTINEDRARAVILERWPDCYVISAGRSLPKVGEFERVSTAAVHAYVQPVMARYLGALVTRVASAGYPRSPTIMQCNGGTMSIEQVLERPANTVRSGPAAGVIAAGAVAGQAGFANAITADMGGTSFDVALVIDGLPQYTDEKLLDFRIPLRVPTIDVETIGAGGGSIAALDTAGFLSVGPRSAGSVPGPACYGRGGLMPTVTDANVVLRRIDVEQPIGSGRLELNANLSERAIDEHIARPLGLSIEDAAAAIVSVIDSKMAGQARIMSIGRGHDPRDFVLIPFGGAGPLHGDSIAREVGIPRVLVPALPGVTSAIGCVEASPQYDFVRTFRGRLEAIDVAAANALVAELIAEGRSLIDACGVAVDEVAVVVAAEMHYEGQRHPLNVDLDLPLDREAIERAFEKHYQRRYGAVLHAPTVLEDLHCSVIGVRPKERLGQASAPAQPWDLAIVRTRLVYFGGAWHDTPVIDRGLLANGMWGVGPAIVQQADTTTVVGPRTRATADAFGNLILEVTK